MHKASMQKRLRWVTLALTHPTDGYTDGIFYVDDLRLTREDNDYLEQLEALLIFGSVPAQNLISVVRDINISFDGNDVSYEANIDYYGIDGYLFTIDDREDKNNLLWAASGINPEIFEYTYLVQQYGYAEPYTQSFEINTTLSGTFTQQ